MKIFFLLKNFNKTLITFFYFLSIFHLIKPSFTQDAKISETDLYPNLFEKDPQKVKSFLDNFNFTEYEENCSEAKYEKCYEISSYYIRNLRFTNFTEISTKFSKSEDNIENIDNSKNNKNNPNESKENSDNIDPNILKKESETINIENNNNRNNLEKDEVVLYNNILSNFYFYAGLTEYYGIIKKKSDLANGFAKFLISAFYGNPKALYELYIILESDLYKIIFELKQYKSIIQNDLLIKYITESKFYSNFIFDTDYEKASISLVFLYTSAILKYPPALNTLAYKYYRGEGVEKSCDSSLKYYKEISMINVHKITNRKRPNHYEKVNLVAYEYAGFLQSKENMNVNAIIDYLKVEANNGHNNVIQQLGQKFLFGQGIDQNFRESFNYFNMGYMNNDTLCTYYLGEHYLNGWGIEPNYTEAMRLFNRAVAQQFDPISSKDKNNKQYVAKALNSIGYIYYYGLGVEKNIKRAYDYFKSNILNYYIIQFYRQNLFIYILNKNFQNDLYYSLIKLYFFQIL